MDGLTARMVIRERNKLGDYPPNSWERLCRLLLLKLAGELRWAKREVRNVKRRLNIAKDVGDFDAAPKLKARLLEVQMVELQAHNVFQGAKALWTAYSPEKENS